MVAIRFIFGVGESGAFPIATRSLSRWMLPAERGFAQGITHAGSRLGAAVTPPLVVWMILRYGWRMPFLTFAVLGLAWSAVWFFYYRDSPEQHRGVNAAELELIHSATGGPRQQVGARVPWRRILSSRNRVATGADVFLLPIRAGRLSRLVSHLFEYPSRLQPQADGLLRQLAACSPALSAISPAAGFPIVPCAAPATSHTRAASLVSPVSSSRRFGILPATLTHNPKLCVAFSCLAFGGLELTVGVSWAIPLDIGGDFAGCTASVMNMCGNIGGAISPALLAYLVKAFGWDVPFFVTSALVCVRRAHLRQNRRE